MRSSEMQLMIQLEGTSIVEEDPVVDGDENDEFVEELGAQSETDSDSDE
jgi:hypothetical protein